MISNRNIINLILEIKKQVLQPYHCLIDSLFLIECFYNVKKTKKTKKTVKNNRTKKTDSKNRPTLVSIVFNVINNITLFFYIYR